MNIKFGFDELKKETLKLLTDYLGIPTEPAKPFHFNDNSLIQSPDFYNSRGNGSDRKKAFPTRTP